MWCAAVTLLRFLSRATQNRIWHYFSRVTSSPIHKHPPIRAERIYGHTPKLSFKLDYNMRKFCKTNFLKRRAVFDNVWCAVVTLLRFLSRTTQNRIWHYFLGLCRPYIHKQLTTCQPKIEVATIFSGCFVSKPINNQKRVNLFFIVKRRKICV